MHNAPIVEREHVTMARGKQSKTKGNVAAPEAVTAHACEAEEDKPC